MSAYIIIGVIAIVVIIFFIAAIKTRNKFVVLRNRVNDQAAQIDVQLKRRFDLIPNLISVVKGQAGFEKNTLESVVQARTHAMNSSGNVIQSAAANDMLTGALHRMLAVAENYPDLKSNAGFIQLQMELSETENKIAHTRQFYNDVVLKYNNGIQMFPASIIAGIFGFSQQAFLAANDIEREVVKISADDFKV